MKHALFLSRKGFNWAGLLAFAAVIGLVVSFSSVATRECSKDNQCGENRYCGSDFSCHKIPVITVTKNEVKYEYTHAAALLSIAIVMAALVVKKWQ